MFRGAISVNYSELKKKSVVNVADGKDLGKTSDLIFTFPQGDISAIIVGGKKFLSSAERYEIPFCCIKKVGDDTILVDLKASRSDENQ